MAFVPSLPLVKVTCTFPSLSQYLRALSSKMLISSLKTFFSALTYKSGIIIPLYLRLFFCITDLKLLTFFLTISENSTLFRTTSPVSPVRASAINRLINLVNRSTCSLVLLFHSELLPNISSISVLAAIMAKGVFNS